MPKRNRSKKMRGGWPWDSSSEGSAEGSGWFDSLKKKTGSATSWFTSDSSTAPAPLPAPSNSYPPASPASPYSVTGGKRRKHRMRGGYSDSVSMTNLASRAAPFSGATARAQAYVGGRKTKRRCHKHKGSRRRHCRK